MRQILEEHFKNVEVTAIAVSGGIDSSALVVSALSAGSRVHVYTFGFDDFDSMDNLKAQALARHFNLPYQKVCLPTESKEIVNTICQLIREYRAVKKTEIECAFPFEILARKVHADGFTHFANGHGADGHFILDKKGMIHYRDTLKKFQYARQLKLGNPRYAQRQICKRIADKYRFTWLMPYFDPRIFVMYENYTWDQMNKPRQKEVLRSQFPELDCLKIPNHSNLQLGDSRIAERIGNAARKVVAPHARSPITAYNKLVKELLGEQ